MGTGSGYSLLETLAALVLFSLLLAAALPHLLPAGVGARAAAEELVADLHLARQLAVSRAAEYAVEFTPAGGPYTGYAVRPAGGPAEPGYPKQLPAGVEAAGPGQVTFRPDGSAQEDADIALVAGPEQVTVRVVGSTGHARVLP